MMHDDVSTAKEFIAKCLNARAGSRAPNPPLQVSNKIGRGFVNDATGRLLCPAGLDWDNQSVRSQIRDDELYDSYLVRFLYDDEKGANGIEKECSRDLYNNNEAKPPRKHVKKASTGKKSTRKNVAQIVGMTEVNTRPIAYCAVMVRFALSDATT
ncbi:hypothetical protein K435DRAFT_435065 [Dendrothele bispora CBS 962.96]|uniref:Uncharacterized protein n=1 Tax=Dendrothele bispora (strain CBS 962.96) TaxID=1314807 RepID=A0A4S8L3L9_DENBC|nr:hypothetical protein K435DRAFT_435065 [Dendrothele bispora CBS 962.96]